jgi:hypothetical protein
MDRLRLNLISGKWVDTKEKKMKVQSRRIQIKFYDDSPYFFDMESALYDIRKKVVGDDIDIMIHTLTPGTYDLVLGEYRTIELEGE